MVNLRCKILLNARTDRQRDMQIGSVLALCSSYARYAPFWKWQLQFQRDSLLMGPGKLVCVWRRFLAVAWPLTHSARLRCDRIFCFCLRFSWQHKIEDIKMPIMPRLLPGWYIAIITFWVAAYTRLPAAPLRSVRDLPYIQLKYNAQWVRQLNNEITKRKLSVCILFEYFS